MNRIWTHIAVDEDNYEIRKFLSLREARHFAERNNLTVVATGEKAVTQRDLYKQALRSSFVHIIITPFVYNSIIPLIVVFYKHL